MASKIVVNLDTSKESYLVTKCKQNDDLVLEAFIYENGLELDLTNKEITIQALKADGTYIIQNTNTTKLNNKITANLDRDFTRVPGVTKIEIVLTESSRQNTTFSFLLEVVGSVIRGAAESFNTVTILENLQNKIVEAGQVKAETEQLIQSGGAATQTQVNNLVSQMADMTNIASLNANGWFKDKKTGLIIQFGTAEFSSPTINVTNTLAVTFPIAFPNAIYVTLAAPETSNPDTVFGSAANVTKAGFNAKLKRPDAVVTGLRWIAIGC